MRERRFLFLYLGAGLALAVGAITALGFIAAHRENEASRITQEAVVRYETGHLYEALAGKLMPMIFWEDAYYRIATHWQGDWIGYQFGPYLNSMNINIVAIFDGDGRLLFHHDNGLADPPVLGRLAANRHVRELLAVTPAAVPARAPVIRTATLDIDGKPYFAAAGAVTPEGAHSGPVNHDTRRTVVFLVRASAASYATLARSFDVAGLQIASAIPDTSGFVSVPLLDAAGETATRLWWNPLRPGSALLRLVIPFLAAVFLLLALVQALIVRRWQSMQHDLYLARARAESAAEESRAKSAFLGAISHELRTPLNAILGFSDMMLAAMFGPLGSPRYHEYARHIRDGGRTLLDRVNDLIEIARIESRDVALERETTDTGVLLADAVAAMRSAAAAKNITLRYEPGDPAWCVCAPISLRQVVTRILDNAIKFSHAGGAVEIALRCDGDATRIEIRDHGIGIEAHYLQKLGRPFVQVESHLARSNDGVGLGLAIAKGLMHLMDGALEVHSTPGAGTTVILRLRAAQPGSSRLAA